MNGSIIRSAMVPYEDYIATYKAWVRGEEINETLRSNLLNITVRYDKLFEQMQELHRRLRQRKKKAKARNSSKRAKAKKKA